MSKAVRLGVWILAVLVIASAAVAVLTLTQKQALDGQNQGLRSQLSDEQNKETALLAKVKKLQDDADALNNKMAVTEKQKEKVQSLFTELKTKSTNVQAQIDQANADRDDWKKRVETITRERDDLMQTLKDRPTQVVYKDRVIQAPAAAPVAPVVVDVTSSQGDQYWAGVLKQKASLQLALEAAKSQLDQVALQVVELKKENSDLSLQVKQLSDEKDDIAQKVKDGGDLADTLAVDLARSRNDQKAVNERADKIKAENADLQAQMRDLSSTKLALEKTISRLTDDKNAIQKKLVQTESVIQSRIDDIWKIKAVLDKRLSDNAPSASTAASAGMELPPIIVPAPATAAPAATPAVAAAAPAVAVAVAPVGKTEGTIISINEASNFIIADLGQSNSTVAVGNALKVYRDSKQIGNVEVIQVRNDICAADIKDKTSDLKVGDVVKFN